jgi:hypothetical protein
MILQSIKVLYMHDDTQMQEKNGKTRHAETKSIYLNAKTEQTPWGWSRGLD